MLCIIKIKAYVLFGPIVMSEQTMIEAVLGAPAIAGGMFEQDISYS